MVKPRKSSGGIGAGGIVGICIVLVLVFSVAAWCVYAYRHPTSKSGLMLIDVSVIIFCNAIHLFKLEKIYRGMEREI